MAQEGFSTIDSEETLTAYELLMGIDSMNKREVAKLYADGMISLGRAALVAGVSVREMMDYLKHKKMPAQYDVEDLEHDMKRFYQRMGR